MKLAHLPRLAVLLAPTAALGIDLSNNLANSSSGVEIAAGSRWLAASFGTGVSAHVLNAVTLRMSNSAPGSATVMVYTGPGLEPATLVATLTPPASIPTTLGDVTYRATSGVPLAANTSYWIVLRPDSGQFEWSWTSNNAGAGDGFQGVWGVSTDTGAFWWSQDIYPTQMRILADVACPCIADFDGSGGTPETGDIAAYFTAWLAGDPSADADCSGGTPDANDIGTFFAQWLAAGC